MPHINHMTTSDGRVEMKTEAEVKAEEEEEEAELEVKAKAETMKEAVVKAEGLG